MASTAPPLTPAPTPAQTPAGAAAAPPAAGSTGDPAADGGRRSPTLGLLLGLAAAVVVIAGLRAFSGTLGPTFFALVIVITLHPVQGWLQRKGVPSILSVIALLIAIYLLLFGLAAALALSIGRLATLLPTYSDQFNDLLTQATDFGERFGVGQEQVQQALSGVSVGSAVGVAQGLLGGLTSALSNFLFVLLLLFFLAFDAAAFPRLMATAATSRPHLVAALDSFASGTRKFLVVSTVFGLVVAVLDVALLYWLSVPLALLWGLLSLITNYIANIGFVLGVIPPALLALLDGGPRTALIVIIGYAVINFIVQSLVQPKFVGDAVGLSVSLTFLSLVFWGFTLGSLGALFAVPLSLLTRAVLVDANPSAHWLLPLLAGSAQDPHDEAPDPAGVLPAEHPQEQAVAEQPAEAQPVGARPADAPPAGTRPASAGSSAAD